MASEKLKIHSFSQSSWPWSKGRSWQNKSKRGFLKLEHACCTNLIQALSCGSVDKASYKVKKVLTSCWQKCDHHMWNFFGFSYSFVMCEHHQFAIRKSGCVFCKGWEWAAGSLPKYLLGCPCRKPYGRQPQFTSIYLITLKLESWDFGQ